MVKLLLRQGIFIIPLLLCNVVWWWVKSHDDSQCRATIAYLEEAGAEVGMGCDTGTYFHRILALDLPQFPTTILHLDQRFDDDCLRRLKTLHTIFVLDLSASGVTNAGLAELGRLRGPLWLTIGDFDLAGYSNLRHAPIVWLAIERGSLGEREMLQIAQIKTLQQVVFVDVEISETTIQSFARIRPDILLCFSDNRSGEDTSGTIPEESGR